jgi:hypothetical protein
MSMVVSSIPRTESHAVTRWDLRYCLRAALLWLAFCAAVGAGVSLRRWTWNHTEDIRFHFDISNGFRWGLNVNKNEQIDYTRAPTWGEFFAGYRNLYAREELSPSRRPQLDYSPFRLLIMGLWVKSVLAIDPRASGWIDRDANPLMWFNTMCAFVGAVGVYFLLRLWLGRLAARRPLDPPRHIHARAVMAALCLWFNPAILLNAHVWPQWDVWCVPFYIWAMYAGSVGAWFWMGVLVASGAMLKGQLLIAAPVLFVWAALSRGWNGWKSLLLAVLGTLTMGVVVGSIWLIPDAHAWAWVAPSILVVIAAGLILSSWLRRYWLYYASAIVCAGMIVGCWHFNGSLDWLRCSFTNSAENLTAMSPGGINLSAILQTRYNWDIDDIAFSLPTHFLQLNDGVSLRWTLRGIYIAMLLLCGIAAAVQTRRRSPRVLIALVAPWVIMYAILPQMRERYLLWGAAMTAVGIGIDLELALLFLLTMAIGTMSIFIRLEKDRPIGDVLEKMIPDIGWVTVLLALMYLYQAWKRDPRYMHDKQMN